MEILCLSIVLDTMVAQRGHGGHQRLASPKFLLLLAVTLLQLRRLRPALSAALRFWHTCISCRHRKVAVGCCWWLQQLIPSR